MKRTVPLTVVLLSCVFLTLACVADASLATTPVVPPTQARPNVAPTPNLASVAPGYDPEPDVIVVDDGGYEERYSDRFYLVAEIVEPSDRKTVESKCAIYKRHPRVPMRAHAPAKSGPHRHCGVDGCRLDRPCADRTG